MKSVESYIYRKFEGEYSFSLFGEIPDKWSNRYLFFDEIKESFVCFTHPAASNPLWEINKINIESIKKTNSYVYQDIENGAKQFLSIFSKFRAKSVHGEILKIQINSSRESEKHCTLYIAGYSSSESELWFDLIYRTISLKNIHQILIQTSPGTKKCSSETGLNNISQRLSRLKPSTSTKTLTDANNFLKTTKSTQKFDNILEQLSLLKDAPSNIIDNTDHFEEQSMQIINFVEDCISTLERKADVDHEIKTRSILKLLSEELWTYEQSILKMTKNRKTLSNEEEHFINRIVLSLRNSGEIFRRASKEYVYMEQLNKNCCELLSSIKVELLQLIEITKPQ